MGKQSVVEEYDRLSLRWDYDENQGVPICDIVAAADQSHGRVLILVDTRTYASRLYNTLQDEHDMSVFVFLGHKSATKSDQQLQRFVKDKSCQILVTTPQLVSPDKLPKFRELFFETKKKPDTDIVQWLLEFLELGDTMGATLNVVIKVNRPSLPSSPFLARTLIGFFYRSNGPIKSRQRLSRILPNKRTSSDCRDASSSSSSSPLARAPALSIHFTISLQFSFLVSCRLTEN